MSGDFFNEPTSATSLIPVTTDLADLVGPLGVVAAFRGKGVISSTTQYGTTPDWAIDTIPWGKYVEGYYTTSLVDGSLVTNAGKAVTTATQAQTTAADKLQTAQGNYVSAHGVTLSAQSAADEAEDTWDAARMAAWKAQIAYQTAARGTDLQTIAAASDAYDAALANVESCSAAFDTANHALTSAQALEASAAGSLSSAKAGKVGADASLAGTQFVLAVAQANQTASDAAAANTPGTDPTRNVSPYVVYEVLGTPTLGGYANGLWAAYASSTYTTTTFNTDGSIQSVNYGLTWARCVYQYGVQISDVLYQACDGDTIQLKWNEVQEVRPVAGNTISGNPYANPPVPAVTYEATDPLAEASYTATPKTETFGTGDMAQVDDGTNDWIVWGDEQNLAQPDVDDGQTAGISIVGTVQVPTVSIAVETSGATQRRQGWLEFTSEPDATEHSRYLTLTASTLENAPPGVEYGGTRIYALPTYAQPSYVTQPLVVTDTLDAASAAEADQRTPDSLMSVTDGARLISDTECEILTTPGLKFSLSQEQSGSMIQAAVEAIANAAWPADPPNTSGVAALRCYSADGDQASAQRGRYKMTHYGNDSRHLRATTYTITSHWIERHMHLDTGAVQDIPQSKTVTLSQATTPYGYFVDPEWTEIPVPSGNESIQLIAQAGENDDPHTYVSSPEIVWLGASVGDDGAAGGS